jgi:citrate synthase
MAEWIEAAEAAARLGVKPATLYSYVSRGLLTRRKDADGRRSLFDPAEVAALRRRSGRDGDGDPAHGPPGAAAGGVVLWESAITALGPDRPYYRGRDALRLARTSPFEEVAGWLWTGADGATPGPWRSLPGAVATAVRAQAAVPDGALPLDRLQLAVTALAVSDPMRFTLEAGAVLTTARALIAGMVEALPELSPAPVPRGSGQEAVAARLWPRLSPLPPRPELVAVLEAALVLLADHELAASTVAARVAAGVRADPYAVVSAALGVLGGPSHGGASLAAQRWLARIRDPGDAARVIGEQLRDGRRIPGFGHQVYGSGDARCTQLLELLRGAAPDHPRLAVSEAALAECTGRGLPPPNVDFAIATLAGVADMIVGAGEALFAIARTAGWLAHALEEYARRTPLRLRASYTGPAPEGPEGPAVTPARRPG